jgi:hypothetical protein
MGVNVSKLLVAGKFVCWESVELCPTLAVPRDMRVGFLAEMITESEKLKLRSMILGLQPLVALLSFSGIWTIE